LADQSCQQKILLVAREASDRLPSPSMLADLYWKAMPEDQTPDQAHVVGYLAGPVPS
jgi:hypothetical protein